MVLDDSKRSTRPILGMGWSTGPPMMFLFDGWFNADQGYTMVHQSLGQNRVLILLAIHMISFEPMIHG